MTRTFLSEVELHERAWGVSSYANRPKLSEIMEAWVVIFWRHDRRDPGYRITLHKGAEEIHEYVTNLLLSSKTRQPVPRLARLYVKQQRVKIKGVKLVFEVDELK